jgi:hypothetical protein
MSYLQETCQPNTSWRAYKIPQVSYAEVISLVRSNTKAQENFGGKFISEQALELAWVDCAKTCTLDIGNAYRGAEISSFRKL